MNSLKHKKQYGLWESPLSARVLAQGLTLADAVWDSSGALVWLERRPERGALVVLPADGQAQRDLNSEYSVRARVGYGGGDFTVGQGQVIFAEAGSGRLYRQRLESGGPQAITPAFGQAASPCLSPDGRWVLFVHTYEKRDVLAVAGARGECWPQVLASGADFYMQPAWRPDGKHIAWIAWDHPNMPWDGTRLYLGELREALDEGAGCSLPALKEARVIAGGENISIFQPLFSPDGRSLAYASDESGWWQLYLYDLESGERRQMTFAEAEHGAPAWNQGQRTYGFSPDGRRLVFIRNQEGRNSLWMVEIESGKEFPLPLPEKYTGLEQLAVFPQEAPDGAMQLSVLASGAVQPPQVIGVSVPKDLTPNPVKPTVRVLRRATSEEFPAEEYAHSEPVTFPGMDGEPAHGLFYPPHNPRFEGLGKPPLLVHIHGGPTSQVRDVFNPRAQFFATRGFAVLDVNYRGSTGYGRAYRERLKGNWGIYDVQDAVSGARALVEAGRVDGGKLVIMGGSAGGFTVLKALTDFPGFFKAGIALYAVSNQFTLVSDTHKFEERYSDSLLGPLPEAAALYRERSPIFYVDRIQDPLAIFQGEEDVVVPPRQSDELVASLRRRGVPHIYHLYPGEGHGFRKPETLEHFYQAVEEFLKQYVLFA